MKTPPPDELTLNEWQLANEEERMTLSAICADELGAHVFRHQVARELDRLGWIERARGLRSCGEGGISLACSDCGCAHVAPYRCNARSCPTCARLASTIIVERVATRAEHAIDTLQVGALWDGPGDSASRKSWRLATGTQQTDGIWGAASRYQHKSLRRSLVRVRRAWGYFWRGVDWGRPVRSRSETTGRMTNRARRDTMFAMGIECGPGGMVHCHAAVYGEFLPVRSVSDVWETSLGWPGSMDLAAMKGAGATELRSSLHEVLKYLTKGVGDKLPAPYRAAAIENAMRGIRRVEMGGALRKAPPVTARDLIFEGQPSCVDCGGGVSTRWVWMGIKPPRYVAENGGFGRDQFTEHLELGRPAPKSKHQEVAA